MKRDRVGKTIDLENSILRKIKDEYLISIFIYIYIYTALNLKEASARGIDAKINPNNQQISNHFLSFLVLTPLDPRD